ncbi:transcriptional regulator [Streptomyces sp. DSM 44917]|uniref:Transcriptional regulator n=1 Tax=Streptomyces boetiae TaxID=3075541 RepID=A0ABU2L9X1_9ACTN|nr:transcriptional regulator [Streptomyces sp. DSM 44917]MDT0308376.1 transcriptional regulator [Streptomyces sp. DSM 44917]
MSADSPDPLSGFDATIHAPNRLRVCALLDTAGEAEFARVQSHLGVSASVLSKHVTVLMDAGYVAQRKATRDTRQRVWLHLTPEGRTAYHRHLAALHAIVGPPPAPAP